VRLTHPVATPATLPDRVTTHAFVWDKGEIRDLGTLGGDSPSLGNAINNAGVIVGRSATASGESHAFRYDGKGGMQDLGTVPGCTRSEATAVNEPGTVVGVSDFCASATGARVFIFSKAVLADLNDVAPAADGSLYVRAFGINNAGSIIGIALAPDFSRSRPFLVVRDGE
jgi:probable HAF family extracellular repeat protein